MKSSILEEDFWWKHFLITPMWLVN
jgi:hypothetical protein